MNIDFRFRSRYSGGQFWPKNSRNGWPRPGVTIATLAGQDTFAGVPAFLDAAKREGIEGVAATKIVLSDPDFRFESELLAYFPVGSYSRTENLLRPF